MFRNFNFIYAGYRVAWIIPLLGVDSTIPLLGGVRGGFLSPFSRGQGS